MFKNIEKVLLSDATKYFLTSNEIYFDFPSVLLFARSPFIVKSLSNIYISNNKENDTSIIQKDFELNNMKHNVYYKSFKSHIEIDIDNFSHDKYLLINFLKEIIDKPCVLNTKHIILIHSVCSLSLNLIQALCILIEKYSHTTHFILTSYKQILGSNILKNSCICLNANINIKKMMELYLKEINHPKQNDLRFINLLCLKGGNDILNSCLLLNLENPEIYIGYLGKQVEFFIKTTCDELRNNNIYTVDKNIKEFMFKINSSCIPMRLLIKNILNFTFLYKPEIVYDIVELSCDIERKLISCNKEIFSLEYFFYELIKKMK